MKTALLLFFLLTVRVWGEEIRLSGPSLAMRFEHTQRRLALMQIGKEGDKPLLCSDREGNSAFWNHGTFTEPLTRFVYPRMNAFESWGYGDNPQTALLFNAVNGFPIYAHNSHTETMAPYSRRVRDYYDVYPEITDAQMSERVPACPSCLAAIFEGNKTIVTGETRKARSRALTSRYLRKALFCLTGTPGSELPVDPASFTSPCSPGSSVLLRSGRNEICQQRSYRR